VIPVEGTDPRLVARIYGDTRARISALVTGLDDTALNTMVATCPAWSVRDVVAHLAAVAEDIASGPSATGLPTSEETAAQVARFGNRDVAGILDAWAKAAARLDQLAATTGLKTPVGDAISHEHDVRGAVGRPGARDSAAVWYASDQLLTMLRPPLPLRVAVEDGQYRSGPDAGDEIVLRTTRFEALRWRTGRRSQVQVVAMDWSDDPTPLLAHLCLFGPADADVLE
jgi:hypothetical protein